METRTLDVRGKKCPVPIVKAKKEIDTLQPGSLLEVWATDPGSVADFEGWTKGSKFAVLKEQRTDTMEGQTIYVHILERKA